MTEPAKEHGVGEELLDVASNFAARTAENEFDKTLWDERGSEKTRKMLEKKVETLSRDREVSCVRLACHVAAG